MENHRRVYQKHGDRGGEMKKLVVRLDQDLWDWIEQVATENRCSKQYVIIRLLDGALKNYQDACQMQMPVPESKP